MKNAIAKIKKISIVGRLAGSLNYLVPKSKLKIPTENAIKMAQNIAAQEIPNEQMLSRHKKMDKSKFAVAGYEKIAQKYTQLYYDDKSDLGFFNQFLTYLPKGSRVLDVGCGPGTFTQHFVSAGFAVEGIDLSKKMITIVRKKLPKARFQLMDMRQLKFPENSFDGIFAAYSLIHIPSEDIVDTLKGFKRVLKPDGIVGLITQKGASDKIVDEPMQPGEKMFFNFFTKERLQKFLDGAGLKLEYQEEAVLADAEGSGSDRVIYTIATK